MHQTSAYNPDNSLTVSGSTENLHRLRLFVTEQAEQAGLDETIVYNIGLAVDEAC